VDIVINNGGDANVQKQAFVAAVKSLAPSPQTIAESQSREAQQLRGLEHLQVTSWEPPPSMSQVRSNVISSHELQPEDAQRLTQASHEQEYNPYHGIDATTR